MALDGAQSDVRRELLLRMGDSTLILGQRLCAWCGHGPALEEDIALANTALDLIGQCQMWLGLAAEGSGQTADDLAYRRDTGAFRNLLLVERPNGDFGQTLMRQFLFDAWHLPTLRGLMRSTDPRIAEIAAKAEREVSYHLDRSADLVIRLGDGTEQSHARMQAALEIHWSFAREPLRPDATDLALAEAGIAPDPGTVSLAWEQTMSEVLTEATLTRPDTDFAQTGARQGRHTEHLGHILSEMQFLQRAYPGATW